MMAKKLEKVFEDGVSLRDLVEKAELLEAKVEFFITTSLISGRTSISMPGACLRRWARLTTHIPKIMNLFFAMPSHIWKTPEISWRRGQSCIFRLSME